MVDASFLKTISYSKVQHTPNPAAQFPSALPPLPVHSVDEKHIPKTCSEVEEELAVHSLFGKDTTENSERISEIKVSSGIHIP